MPSTKQLLADIARDKLSIPTLDTRNADSLDFHTVSVWGIAAALDAAFEAGARAVRQDRSVIDIHELLRDRHQVAVIWSIEDVQFIRPDLDDDQAWKVLQQSEDVHDCECGFTWAHIETVAGDMYPEPIATNNE
jgi:hypothetical protein